MTWLSAIVSASAKRKLISCWPGHASPFDVSTRMPGGLHPVPDLAQERLVVGRGEDVVVEDVRHRRRQAGVLLLVRLLEGLAEEIELELAAHHRREAERGRALELRLQHLARRRLHRRPVVPLHVAEHERRRLEPRDAAERRQVGPDVEVAVALLPARERVARHRVHLHLEREQVVAPLHPVPRVHLLEEELGVEALPHQPALHVGEGDDDGVDRAGSRPSARSSSKLSIAAILFRPDDARILTAHHGSLADRIGGMP